MTKEHMPQPAPMSFEHVARMAKEITLRDGGHVPTLIIDGSQTPVIVQIAPLAPSHTQRLDQMFSAGAILAHSGRVGRLRRVFFISEAWLSTAHEGSLPDVSPSQDPDRTEVLIVSAYAPGTQHTDLALVEMIRDPDGVLRELRDIDWSGASEEHVKSPLLLAFVNGFLSRAN